MFRSLLTYLDTTAAEQQSGGRSPIFSIVLIVGMIAVFYFFIIRPQKKQDKQIADMRNSLEVGDEIVTIGGIIGTILIIKDDKVMIETGNDKTKLTILRTSIKSILKDEETESK